MRCSAFLRSIGLDPIEWEVALEMTGTPSPYIGEVIDVVFARAQALIVLMTPDDIVHLDPALCEAGDPELVAQAQPRPNVLIEAGMALGRYPERTIIVEFGTGRRHPAWVAGRSKVRKVRRDIWQSCCRGGRRLNAGRQSHPMHH